MTTPDWSLRDATIVDLGFIFRVYRTTMKDYIEAVYEWNEQTQRLHYEETFKKDDYCIIQSGGDDIGVFSVLNMDSYLFLSRIEILPAYQNQGIGTKILTSLIVRAHAQRKPVMLRVYKLNPAVRLYKRLGWQIIRQDETQYDMLYATVD
ncbi:MAG: GNAT family N-acetyltransferase [Chloroflexota bacterium]